MLRISFLIGNLNKEHGGAQQLLYDLCTHLPADEFETTIYYLFGEGSFKPAFETIGTEVIDLRADSNYDVRAFVRLVRGLRATRPDVVHTNSPISGAWGRFAARLAGVQNVVSVEHNVHDAYPLKHRVVNAATLPLADAIVGVSVVVSDSIDGIEKTWLKTTTAPDQLSIPNGVDVETIDAAQRNADDVLADCDGIEPSDTIVGTMGSHTTQKGFVNLVHAMARLRPTHPNVKAIVLGDGPLRPSLERVAETEGVADTMTFTGYVEDVYPFLSHFDIAVFPSRWEGFGLVVAEAMAAGIPVIASDIPAFREVVGNAGVVIRPDDPEMLAGTISDLLNDRNQRNQLGMRGRDRIERCFLIEHTAREYAELYRNIVNG